MPFSVSHTKLSSFRRCVQRYHWQYVDRYSARPTVGQTRGSAGHAALAIWHTIYEREPALGKAWETWSADGYPAEKEWDLLETSLRRYFDWSDSQRDTFVVKVAEQKFEIEFQPTGSLDPILFIGYIDGVVEDSGRTWLLEHKFYKRLESNGLEIDHQTSLYLLAANILGFSAQGVIYNQVRVADTKIAVEEPAIRRRIYRNPAGLSHIQDELMLQARRMMEYHNKGEKPYRNPTKDCHWDCPFYQPCLLMNDDGQEPTEVLQNMSQIRRHDANQEEW